MTLVLEVITDAYRLVNIIDETSELDADMRQTGLTILNDLLLNEAEDGLRVGWFKQSSVTNVAPLRDADLFGVKRILAQSVATANGIDILKTNPTLAVEIGEARRQLVKRSIRYFESDLSELQRPQGGPWGGPSWI